MYNQAAGWTHTFSPTLISDFRQTFQYFSAWLRSTSQGLGFPQQIGIPVPPQIPATLDNVTGTGENNHFPEIGFDGGYNGFGGIWGGGSALNPRTSWHFGDTVTWLRGRPRRQVRRRDQTLRSRLFLGQKAVWRLQFRCAGHGGQSL